MHAPGPVQVQHTDDEFVIRTQIYRNCESVQQFRSKKSGVQSRFYCAV